MKDPLIAVCLVLTSFAPYINAQKVNEGSALDAEFQQRVADYLKLRKSLEDGLPPVAVKKGKSDLKTRQQELAKRIRAARATAKQGDICSPDIAAELRRLIGLAMQGANATRVKRSIDSSDHLEGEIVVNGPLPDQLPMPSVPPSLLANLPHLPSELAYRIVRNALVLHDTMAGIVIDYVPNAVPAIK